MPEDTETTEPEEQTSGSVPEKRFNKVYAQLQDEKRARAELESRLQALEDKDKPEMERLAKEHERAIKRAEEAEARAEQVEREARVNERRSLVTEAAANLKFQHPGDAALYVNLDEIEDAKSAERALKDVIKQRAYLVEPVGEKPKGLERVVAGQTTGEERKLSAEEFELVGKTNLVADALASIGKPLNSE